MISLFEKIKTRLEQSRVYKTENGYEYFVYPYKGLIPTNPSELDYVAKIISKKIRTDVDFIFTFEMDGVLTAYKVASLLKKPFVCAKSFHYNIPGPIVINQKTGYYNREMFFSLDGLKPKRVAIVDCIHSTGGSIKAALKIFAQLNIEVTNICVVVNKKNYNNTKFLNKIEDKFFAIFDAKILDGKVVVNKSQFFK